MKLVVGSAIDFLRIVFLEEENHAVIFSNEVLQLHILNTYNYMY